MGVVVTLLLRNRLLLLASILLFCTAGALTFDVLHPEGLVRARERDWGPDRPPPRGAIAGYASDRRGSECGLVRRAQSEIVEQRAIAGCHAYLAPEVVELAGRTIAIWEHAGGEVAVGEVRPDLSVGKTVRLARPRSPGGALMPRTDVALDGERIAIRYLTADVVTIGADLGPWPGGVLEVASARLGARGTVLVGGALLLMTLYFMAAGWALSAPSSLRRRQRGGFCVEAELPERGSAVVIDGDAIEADLERAAFFGVDPNGAGSRVTFVLDEMVRGGAYRSLGRIRPLQVWIGGFVEALEHAQALRTGALAIAIFAASALLLALDAYLVW